MTGALPRWVVFSLAGLAGIAWVGCVAAAPVTFEVPLSGAQQVPPVKTAGTGTADLTWNPTKRTVSWHITYRDMSSPVTMAHFHHAPKGENGKVRVWLTHRGRPVASPIVGKATLSRTEAKQFEAGEWYINVHTKKHPAGEIRGQVIPPKG